MRSALRPALFLETGAVETPVDRFEVPAGSAVRKA